MAEKLKYKVEFKRSNGSYYDKEYEFNDENHFNNWHAKQIRDESYRKIIGFERVFTEAKEYSTQDLMKCWEASKSNKFVTFQQWHKSYFNKIPE